MRVFFDEVLPEMCDGDMIHMKLASSGNYATERFIIALWIIIVIMASLISPYGNQPNSVSYDSTREKEKYELVKSGLFSPVLTNFAGDHFPILKVDGSRD